MVKTEARVGQIAAIFNEDATPIVEVLCDRYEPSALAYRIVRADLSSRDLTYGELRAESERFAAALARRGIGKGDRVATLMSKSRELLVTLMAVWRLGAVYVPLFTAFAPPAIAFRLQGSRAKVVICDPAQEPKLRAGDDIPANAPWLTVTTGPGCADKLGFHDLMTEPADPIKLQATNRDDPVIHIFTSGTTGRPKGVIVPKRALAGFQAYAEFGLDLRPDDLYWCAADPGWAYGLYFGILGSLTTGTPSLWSEANFAAESTFAILDRYRVTNLTAAPTVYRSLRASGQPVPQNLALRCASSAGEPLTPEVNDWAVTALGLPVHDHYGQTEAGMLINNHHHPELKRPIKPGSMGQPMPGWAAVVLHETEDRLIGPNEKGRVAMEVADSAFAWFGRYADDPGKSDEKFAGNGRWYLTGDTGSVDDEGYFRFSARDDDVIIMAGYRIGPFDIESCLSTHPDVVESAVIAVPDEIRGEVIEAFVVRRESATPAEDLDRELQNWVKTRYAAHAYPRAVHFVSDLPKTPSGKIQRYVLRDRRRVEVALAKASEPILSTNREETRV